MDDLPLGLVSRDVTWQEEWPEVEGYRIRPEHVSKQFWKISVTVNIYLQQRLFHSGNIK